MSQKPVYGNINTAGLRGMNTQTERNQSPQHTAGSCLLPLDEFGWQGREVTRVAAWERGSTARLGWRAFVHNGAQMGKQSGMPGPQNLISALRKTSYVNALRDQRTSECNDLDDLMSAQPSCPVGNEFRPPEKAGVKGLNGE
ncbi:unnamed protein product [Leuciscus chuanchicus]